VQDGRTINEFSISFDCETIEDGASSGSFHVSFLENIAPRFKKVISRFNEFKTVVEARAYWQRSQKDKMFLLSVYEPIWVKYEGKFRFKVPCPNSDPNCNEYGRDGTVLTKVRDKIAASYPEEKLDLLPSGGSPKGEIFIDIYCDRSLETKLDLYYRWNKEGFGKWDPFFLAFTSYWKKR
jgi:hypothetical protein